MDDPDRRRGPDERRRLAVRSAALVAALLGVISITSGCAAPDREPGPTTAAGGRTLYERHCASCHGVAGDGKGPAAYLLFPKPRNFQDANFKLRSTPPGELPTDDDLKRTIRRGIPGTAMFGFGELLDEGELDAVVGYLKDLSPAFDDA